MPPACQTCPRHASAHPEVFNLLSSDQRAIVQDMLCLPDCVADAEEGLGE